MQRHPERYWLPYHDGSRSLTTLNESDEEAITRDSGEGNLGIIETNYLIPCASVSVIQYFQVSVCTCALVYICTCARVPCARALCSYIMWHCLRFSHQVIRTSRAVPQSIYVLRKKTLDLSGLRRVKFNLTWSVILKYDTERSDEIWSTKARCYEYIL